MANNEVAFGLVHGAWHGAWCWELLQAELDSKGYKSIAMDLPINSPHANFDDYADAVIDSLKNETDVVLVGHSRAGNVIPRAAGRLAIRKLIYLCSSFEPATIHHPTKEEERLVPPRNSEMFKQGINIIDGEITEYDKDMAKELFYNDCTEEIKERAASQLRPQRRSDKEPILSNWPDVAQDYIICKGDLVVNPAWSRYAAKKWLGVEPIEFHSGHSPFLSKPNELARLLISLAE